MSLCKLDINFKFRTKANVRIENIVRHRNSDGCRLSNSNRFWAGQKKNNAMPSTFLGSETAENKFIALCRNINGLFHFNGLTFSYPWNAMGVGCDRRWINFTNCSEKLYEFSFRTGTSVQYVRLLFYYGRWFHTLYLNANLFFAIAKLNLSTSRYQPLSNMRMNRQYGLSKICSKSSVSMWYLSVTEGIKWSEKKCRKIPVGIVKFSIKKILCCFDG